MCVITRPTLLLHGCVHLRVQPIHHTYPRATYAQAITTAAFIALHNVFPDPQCRFGRMLLETNALVYAIMWCNATRDSECTASNKAVFLRLGAPVLWDTEGGMGCGHSAKFR